MLRAWGDLFGELVGAGPPRVLALHGWGRSRADLVPVLAAAGRPGVALDLPGFGASPPPPEAWGAAGYAEALLPVLDDLDAPAVVLAHSFGGRAAVHLAGLAPDRVGALVLTGVPLLRPPSAGPPRRPPLAYRAVRRLHRLGLVPAARMEAARRRHGSADYRAATGVMRDVLVRVVNETYEAELAALRCPVELVWGADDRAAPVTVASAAAALVPGGRARLSVLDGVDHDVPARRPDALADAVRAHLPA